MDVSFRILETDEIETVIPLVERLNDFKVSREQLKRRFNEMQMQNYECVGVFNGSKLVGCSGMWFCTRHYSGKSLEPDHVVIDEAYRGKGIGKSLFKWIYKYAKSKGCEAIELNTYVQNFPSHKFYYNEGFKALGYHFVKKL